MPKPMKRKRPRTAVVGFVVTPSEIQNRINAIDRAVQLLNQDVAAAAARLNQEWVREWAAYTRRWAIERDSYATWDARLFATRIMPRLEAFEESYRQWARQYQAKTKLRPQVADAAPQSSMSDAIVPTPLWYIAAGAVALVVLLKTR